MNPFNRPVTDVVNMDRNESQNTAAAAETRGFAAEFAEIVAAAGVDTVSMDAPLQSISIRMTINNRTQIAQRLSRVDLDGGRWVQAPRQVLLPGQCATAIAQTEAREHVLRLDYLALDRPRTRITYALHTSADGTDPACTGASNPGYRIAASLDGAFPNPNVRFDLS